MNPIPRLALALAAMGTFLSTGCGRPDGREIENLKAFSKLYGYVRYFHPSDEAANIDWDKFALFGSERVLHAKNEAALRDVLKSLFLPVAPTARIYLEGEEPADQAEADPARPESFKIASWQHLGVELPYEGSIYKSVRLNCINRVPVIDASQNPAVLAQTLDARSLRGKEFRLTAFVKADAPNDGDAGRLWVRVDKEDQTVSFFDNMRNRPILSPEWTEYRIDGTVSAEAVSIVFGGQMVGTGKAWFDDFGLSVKKANGGWEPVSLANPGFETDVFPPKENGWNTRPGVHAYALDDRVVHGGLKSLVISGPPARQPEYVIPEKLFDREVKMGEAVEARLTEKLRCRVPLALPVDENGTLGKSDAYPLDALRSRLNAIKRIDMTGDRLPVRLGGVVIAWNVFQHFYPYFDVVSVDWEKVFEDTIARALRDKTGDEFYDTLRIMVAKLEDGHGVVYYSPEIAEGGFPIRVDWIENRIVVTGSENPLFARGDIIESIEGRTGEEELRLKEELVSGAPPLRRYRALNMFGWGPSGTSVEFETIRDGSPLRFRAERTALKGNLFFNGIQEFSLPSFRKIEDGIFYLNMSVSEDEFRRNREALAAAKGVIIDWRWAGNPDPKARPVSALDLVAALTDRPVRSAIFNVPRVVYPDRRDWEFDNGGWPLEPNPPRLGGKVLFIDEPSVVSFGETCMGIVEAYKLAETVGEPTAGTNGNANFLNLPGRYRIMWTGMQVLKHDGSQHHLIGIQPTYPVQRTVKAVREGRDEFLDKAIEVIKRSDK